MAIQSESERSWLFDSSSASRLRLLPPRLVGGFWFISKRIICTHCSIACADKHGSCRYISSADFPSPQGVNKECSEMLWACVCMQILKLLVQSLLLLLHVFSFKVFFFKAFSFKAFCSKRFLQRILKDIKGSRNQTSCCETLTRRNLSATKSATYVRLVFPKILGAAVRREALLDKKTDSKVLVRSCLRSV